MGCVDRRHHPRRSHVRRLARLARAPACRPAMTVPPQQRWLRLVSGGRIEVVPGRDDSAAAIVHALISRFHDLATAAILQAHRGSGWTRDAILGACLSAVLQQIAVDDSNPDTVVRPRGRRRGATPPVADRQPAHHQPVVEAVSYGCAGLARLGVPAGGWVQLKLFVETDPRVPVIAARCIEFATVDGAVEADVVVAPAAVVSGSRRRRAA